MGSLALDAQNYPHITYCNGTGLAGDGTLMYARWTGKIWDIQTVDSNFATGSGSISLDSNDKPHISYSGAHSSVFVDLAYLMYATATEPTQTPTPSPTQAPLLTVSAFSS